MFKQDWRTGLFLWTICSAIKAVYFLQYCHYRYMFVLYSPSIQDIRLKRVHTSPPRCVYMRGCAQRCAHRPTIGLYPKRLHFTAAQICKLSTPRFIDTEIMQVKSNVNNEISQHVCPWYEYTPKLWCCDQKAPLCAEITAFKPNPYHRKCV